MPIVYIHGVNTREGSQLVRENAARDEYLRRLVLAPLAAALGLPGLATMAVDNPYWGQHGAVPHWQNVSAPKVGVRDALGEEPSAAEAEFAMLFGDASRQGTSSANRESLGVSPSTPKMLELARRDLPDLIAKLVTYATVIDTESQDSPGHLTDEERGRIDALLGCAAEAVAADQGIRSVVNQCTSDEELIEYLSKRIVEEFQSIVDTSSDKAGERNYRETLGGSRRLTREYSEAIIEPG